MLLSFSLTNLTENQRCISKRIEILSSIPSHSQIACHFVKPQLQPQTKL